MKKLTIFTLLLLLLVGCSLNNVQRDKDLEASIHSIVADKDESDIHLNSLTSFDWEKAFLFTPYSTQEMIEEELGTDFKDPSDIDWRDDIYLLVFLLEDKAVRYAEMERQGADFLIGDNTYLTPPDDVIQIESYE